MSQIADSRTYTQSEARRRTPKELAAEAQIMAVALAQPHRRGIPSAPSFAWLTTALGQFCRRHWRNEDAMREHWLVGEWFAQLIDAERIARGFTPRQCAEAATLGSSMSIEERLEVREATADALRQAEAAIREVDDRAVRAVHRVTWDDLPPIPTDEGRVYNGLFKLRRHFEALDTRSRRP